VGVLRSLVSAYSQNDVGIRFGLEGSQLFAGKHWSAAAEETCKGSAIVCQCTGTDAAFRC
jgi:hypothetical protein